MPNLEDAILLAIEAHRDQKDKAGATYILHPLRVMLFMTAVLTGAREGELIGLQWGDVDWLNSRPHIRRTFNHGKFMEPKSKASRRNIDLAPELVHELKQIEAGLSQRGVGPYPSHRTRNPENPANLLHRRFFPALRRADLPRMRFHNLRHTYVSLLIAQGEHPKYTRAS